MIGRDWAPRCVEPLARRHDRAAFDCGEPALNDYFKRQASQDVKRRVTNVFVLAGERPEDVAGYYTLSAHAMAFNALPEDVSRKLPRYPEVPTMLIGRLARDLRYQAKGVGAFLLIDAIKRVLAVASTVAAFAIVVDAKDDRTARFYRTFGFMPISNNPFRLFLPLGMVGELLQLHA